MRRRFDLLPVVVLCLAPSGPSSATTNAPTHDWFSTIIEYDAVRGNVVQRYAEYEARPQIHVGAAAAHRQRRSMGQSIPPAR